MNATACVISQKKSTTPSPQPLGKPRFGMWQLALHQVECELQAWVTCAKTPLHTFLFCPPSSDMGLSFCQGTLLGVDLKGNHRNPTSRGAGGGGRGVPHFKPHPHLALEASPDSTSGPLEPSELVPAYGTCNGHSMSCPSSEFILRTVVHVGACMPQDCEATSGYSTYSRR